MLEASFAQLVAPMGCHGSNGSHTRVQRATEAYHAEVKQVRERDLRARVVRAALNAKRLDTALRARIEYYLMVTCDHRSWWRMTDTQRSAAVVSLYDAIRGGAVLAIESLERAQ